MQFTDYPEYGVNLAAVLIGKRKVELVNLNDPKLTNYQVRVNIEYSAICGTQIGEWNQSRGKDEYLPHCFGHEGVGRVLEVGPKVRNLVVGDRVVVSWIKNQLMSDGPPQFFDVGSGRSINAGECCTFIKRGVFPVNRLTKIKENLNGQAAAVLGCAFLTSYAALKVATDNFTHMSEQLVIVGAGGIGLSLYYLCMSLDVRAVCVDVAAVVDKIRLKDADVKCACIDEARVKYEHSCSTVIVCSGHLSAFELGESLLMRNSGSLILVGNPPNGHKVPFDVKPILYGRKIVGVGEKDLKLPEDMYELINLVNRGRLNMDKVIQASYHINDLGEAFSRVEAGVGGKTLIKMN